MKLVAIALALTAASPQGQAADAKAPELQLRPKAAMAGTTQHRDAPFVSPLDEHEISLLPKPVERLQSNASPCDGARSLCYDPNARHLVYKPARALMPDLPGLRPENISVRRDRIVFRYSF